MSAVTGAGDGASAFPGVTSAFTGVPSSRWLSKLTLPALPIWLACWLSIEPSVRASWLVCCPEAAARIANKSVMLDIDRNGCMLPVLPPLPRTSSRIRVWCAII